MQIIATARLAVRMAGATGPVKPVGRMEKLGMVREGVPRGQPGRLGGPVSIRHAPAGLRARNIDREKGA